MGQLVVTETDRRTRQWRRAALIVGAGVIAVDQVTKSIALAVVAHERRDGGVPTIRVVRNTGAGLGLGSGHPLVITGLAVAVTAVVAILTLRTRNRSAAFAGAIVFAGAAGNLADRFFRAPGFGRGAVIDWIHISGYSPTFNVADLAIRAGAITAVLVVVATGWGQHRMSATASGAEGRL